MPPEAIPAKTLERIVTASEKLFATKGYHGTTLREITREARVNLAAVNYHHGDKAGLYLEILRGRMRSLNEVRLARLTVAEREAGPGPAPLEAILEAMAGPLFSLGTTAGDRDALRLLGRCLLEPLPFTEELLAAEFQPAMSRFAQALRRHAPALSPEEFIWRLNFVVGALHHTLATLHKMKARTRGICRDDDHAVAQARFISFAAQAFSPPTSRLA